MRSRKEIYHSEQYNKSDTIIIELLLDIRELLRRKKNE